MRKYLLYITSLLLIARGGYCQAPGNDTVLKGSVIEVIQAYKPQVRQAPKPEWLPVLPPADTFHRVFNYVVPQQSLYYVYHSDPFKPLALGKDTVPLPLPDYIKAGVGNLSTVYLDAGVSSLATADYETYFHVHHLSQNGDIKYEQSALSGIESEGMLFHNSSMWHGLLNLERNQYNFYGFDQKKYKYSDADSLRQTYTTIEMKADYKKLGDEDGDMSYNPSVSAYYYGARFQTHESSAGVALPFVYDADSVFEATLTLSDNYAQLKTDSPSIGNNLLKIVPGASVYREGWKAWGRLGLAFGNTGNVSLLPEIEANKKIAGTGYKVGCGWQSSIVQNTYRQLTSENPYILQYYPLKQSRNDELYVSGVGYYNVLQFAARIGWVNFRSLPTYLDTLGDRKQFQVAYDTVSAMKLQFSCRYFMSDMYEAGVQCLYYKYFNGTSTYPWNLPNFTLRGEMAVKPVGNLVVTGYLCMLSGVHGIDISRKVTELKAGTDIGLNGEYRINLHFNVFVQADNILNQKYQQYMGYEMYGINIFGGVRWKF